MCAWFRPVGVADTGRFSLCLHWRWPQLPEEPLELCYCGVVGSAGIADPKALHSGWTECVRHVLKPIYSKHEDPQCSELL